MRLPTVETASVTPRAIQQVRTFGGKFSHDEYLPLKVRVKRKGWFGRAISVTTLEDSWYEDAITRIFVPAGFTYDLASIPRLVWCIVSPWDIALESLFHDLIYRRQHVKRALADYTMRSMMEDRGVPFLIRWIVYLGVRVGGWRAWNRWAKLNAEAERVAQATAEASPDRIT